MSRPLLFVAVPLLLSCSDYGVDRIDDEPLGADDRVIQVLPEWIDFGDVATGSVVTDTISISSIGAAGIELEPLHIQGSGTFTILNEDEVPSILAPGATFELEVAYEPATSQDQATVVVQSNATVPQVTVDLSGVGVMPDLVFDPQVLELFSYDGNPVYSSFIARNEGTVDLVVDSWVLQGEAFEVETDLPATLAPGEESVIDVTWYPSVEGTELGYFWAASNDPAGNELATLEGTYQLPCLGLHEADTRGWVEMSGSKSGVTITHIGEDLDVCIDRWYVYISDDTQDAGAGDPMFVDSDVYGVEGSIVLSQGDSVSFDYGNPSVPAWWCVEETQQVAQANKFDFTGAQVPSALLEEMLAGGLDNDAIWREIREHPMFIVGRQRGWATTVAGGSTSVQIQVTNIGRVEGTAQVFETIPVGMTASDFTVEPSAEVQDEDGNVIYTWEVELEAAVDTDIDVQTVYDEASIGYTLTIDDEACSVRTRTNEPVVQWGDADGITRQAKGSPLIIECW